MNVLVWYQLTQVVLDNGPLNGLLLLLLCILSISLEVMHQSGMDHIV